MGDMLICVEELGEGSGMAALSLADAEEGSGFGTAAPLDPSEDKGSSSAAASGPAFGSVDMGDDLFDQESGKTACLCQKNCLPKTAKRSPLIFNTLLFLALFLALFQMLDCTTFTSRSTCS
jgi:hypothetical protein